MSSSAHRLLCSALSVIGTVGLVAISDPATARSSNAQVTLSSPVAIGHAALDRRG